MNKTIKVIDLLNKIANGKEVPKKIKYDDDIYEYDYDEKNYAYFFIDHYNYLFDEDITQILDDEVEIIEDNDKLKHGENYVDFADLIPDSKFDYLYEMESKIIDHINKIEEALNVSKDN